MVFPVVRLKWDEEAHPRNPAGSEEGGRFSSGGGGEDLQALSSSLGAFAQAPVARKDTSEETAVRLAQHFKVEYKRKASSKSFEADHPREPGGSVGDLLRVILRRG